MKFKQKCIDLMHAKQTDVNFEQIEAKVRRIKIASILMKTQQMCFDGFFL